MTKYNIDSLIDKALHGTGDTDQHGITLFALACSLRAKNILELGVRGGGTTLPLLIASYINDGKVTSVDLVDNGFRPPEMYNLFWNFIVEDALTFLTNNTNMYDLIYIDDLHASEHVYKELKLISKFITNKTVIVLHDLMHTNAQPNYNTTQYYEGEWEGTGPYGGVLKFINEHPNYEFSTIPVNHGLTILRKIL